MSSLKYAGQMLVGAVLSVVIGLGMIIALPVLVVMHRAKKQDPDPYFLDFADDLADLAEDYESISGETIICLVEREDGTMFEFDGKDLVPKRPDWEPLHRVSKST